MSPDSLQHLLASRRPGDEFTDPEVEAALRALEKDPTALSAAEREMAFDEALRASLQSVIAVPHDLQERLMAIPSTMPAASSEAGNVISIPRRRFLRLAALAGTAAAFTGGYFLFRPEHPQTVVFADWKNAAASWANAPKLDFKASELFKLKDHLASEGTIVPVSIPASLVQLQTAGCHSLTVDKEKISVVCFLKDGTLFHLFTTVAAQVASADGFLESTGPKIWSEQGWNFATWKTGPQGYMLLTQAPEKDLRAIFA